jgi:hypothetical protein
MCIDPAKTLTIKSVGFQEMKNFGVVRLSHQWKRIQEPQYLLPVLEITARQFTYHKRMAQHMLIVK